MANKIKTSWRSEKIVGVARSQGRLAAVRSLSAAIVRIVCGEILPTYPARTAADEIAVGCFDLGQDFADRVALILAVEQGRPGRTNSSASRSIADRVGRRTTC